MGTPLILGGLFIVAFLIGATLYYFSLQCKDGEEMIEGKCLFKCTDGQTRVGVVCTTPTGSEVVVCKDGEEMIEGKCLIKCTDGKTRVGVVCTTPIGRKGYCISDPNNPTWHILKTDNLPGWKSGDTCYATDGTITGWSEKPCYGGASSACNSFIGPDGNVKF